MRYITLINSGAKEVKPLTFYRGREKVQGYMYGGDAVLELSNIRFHFQLWHHSGNTITKKQVEQKISLKGITIKDKYYDVHWYAIMTEKEIYLHPKGWFHNDELRSNSLVKKRGNYNFMRDNLSISDEAELYKAGFFKLIV